MRSVGEVRSHGNLPFLEKEKPDVADEDSLNLERGIPRSCIFSGPRLSRHPFPFLLPPPALPSPAPSLRLSCFLVRLFRPSPIHPSSSVKRAPAPWRSGCCCGPAAPAPARRTHAQSDPLRRSWPTSRMLRLKSAGRKSVRRYHRTPPGTSADGRGATGTACSPRTCSAVDPSVPHNGHLGGQLSRSTLIRAHRR